MIEAQEQEPLNFYDEIKKKDVLSLEKFCLITKLPLTDHFVELECKHTFNYTPLFNEIFYGQYLRQRGNENIKCPYCRNKQTQLLPFIPELGFKQIEGINYKSSLFCLAVLKSGKRKGKECQARCRGYSGGMCERHRKKE